MKNVLVKFKLDKANALCFEWRARWWGEWNQKIPTPFIFVLTQKRIKKVI